ncbi:MAG TPA: cytochrome c oxidase subunit II [Thermoanaerobaculia bacterium]|nr:cytochrome c oxidase subunit II [Thermoanaerobaculia bacterium]
MRDYLARYMPPDYSEHGAALDRLNANVHWLMLFLFVAWMLLFLYMIVRFRASKHPKAIYHGTHSHISTYAEAGIAVVEVILLVGFSIPLWYQWTKPPDPAKNPLVVRVVAEQFAWNVHYPGPDNIFGRTSVKFVTTSNPLGIDPSDPHAKDDIATINDLRLQLNRPVIVRISSKDVIHSFGLPYMRVKQDATPGMEVPVHFTPVKASAESDVWEIACAQLCGLGHYRMRGRYHVQPKADFDKWMAGQTPVVASISG